MEGSGFRERQWLVSRGDRFVQLSELLYRVAQEADGERTLDEIAGAVTEQADRIVTVEHVRTLMAKLVALGIMADPGGRAVPPTAAPSVLQVGMRMKTLGPAVLDPLTGALKWLFAPPLLIPILAAIVGAHVWLYALEAAALQEGILQVLFNPALVLPLFVIIVAAGFVHEFGHASALRYGGGRARGMGVGFYLIYPALYTDTSDAYRLGRWARVRVDLGGFYFHLIAAVALMALAFGTQSEWLLVAVLTINFELARQLLVPIVRFDGYWLFADLTGIPDPLTAVVPFVRSVLPGGRRWKGTRLPPLRRWVKLVFGAYVAVTIPALGALLYLFVTRAPMFVRAAWESVSRLAIEVSAALGEGDVVGAVSAGGQLAILALPLIGVAYVMFSLGRTVWLIASRRRSFPPAAARQAGVE